MCSACLLSTGFNSGLGMLHHMMYTDGLELIGSVAAAKTTEALALLLKMQVGFG